MDYLLSLAVGGIKVQVREEDAERALVVLESLAPADDATPVEGEGVPEPDGEGAAPEEPEEAPAPTPEDNVREQYARRALNATLCSLLVAPVGFYAAYLLLMTVFSEGKLSPARWWGVWILLLVTPVFMFLSLELVFVVLRAFHGVW